jgi:AcrR family transcriptional regulator
VGKEISDLNSHSVRDPAQSLARLLDGAAYTFVERGYRAATVHDICARAQVGIGTFYAHFAHKKELIKRVLLERGVTLARTLSPEAFGETETLALALRKTTDEPVAAGLWRAWNEAVVEEPDLATFQKRWRTEAIDKIAPMIEQARRSAGTAGNVADARATAWATMTLTRAMLVDGPNGLDVQRLAGMIRCLVFGVTTEPALVSHKRVARND